MYFIDKKRISRTIFYLYLLLLCNKFFLNRYTFKRIFHLYILCTHSIVGSLLVQNARAYLSSALFYQLFMNISADRLSHSPPLPRPYPSPRRRRRHHLHHQFQYRTMGINIYFNDNPTVEITHSDNASRVFFYPSSARLKNRLH
jgi:hypothetical protein